jgi:hypothetical protein
VRVCMCTCALANMQSESFLRSIDSVMRGLSDSTTFFISYMPRFPYSMLLNINFFYSLQFLSKKFLILKKNSADILPQMHKGLPQTYPLFSSDFCGR